jgi:broad specificity phosphatase PhoE
MGAATARQPRNGGRLLHGLGGAISRHANMAFASVLLSCALTASPQACSAGMLTFPLPAPLHNNIIFIRAGESFADARHEIETNPVKKLRQDNALTSVGRQQAVDAAKTMAEMGFPATYIWTSNTERAYETANIIAREIQLGQNRIVPEYSFLDARSIGMFEGKNDVDAWRVVHEKDAQEGVKYKAPENNDGTPTDSISDVLVRGNQLLSTIESMYSGENVVVVSPDSEVLSVLFAALSTEDPDGTLPLHAKYGFRNGEVRTLAPVVKPSELLVTGQTRGEADATSRLYRSLRVAGTKVSKDGRDNWIDLWHASVDIQSR